MPYKYTVLEYIHTEQKSLSLYYYSSRLLIKAEKIEHLRSYSVSTDNTERQCFENRGFHH